MTAIVDIYDQICTKNIWEEPRKRCLISPFIFHINKRAMASGLSAVHLIHVSSTIYRHGGPTVKSLDDIHKGRDDLSSFTSLLLLSLTSDLLLT